MVLTHLVHDLIEFCVTPMALLGFVAILFLSTGHEYSSMLAILPGWQGPVCIIGESRFVLAVTSIEAILAVGMFMG
jgi:hypothetical protein